MWLLMSYYTLSGREIGVAVVDGLGNGCGEFEERNS